MTVGAQTAREDLIAHLRQRARADSESYLNKFSIPVTESGCWIWLGTIQNNGYGVIDYTIFNGKRGRCSAHRRSWETFRGPIPNGLFVCHTCDIRCCINPDHLFLGTHGDNFRDMREKGRYRGLSNFTDNNIREIRASKLSMAKLAKLYDVGSTTVSKIKSGKSWGHVR